LANRLFNSAKAKELLELNYFGSPTRSVDVILARRFNAGIAQTNQISSRQRRLNRSQPSLRDERIIPANLSGLERPG